MAAGSGSRMPSSTPKVLHRVAGVPILTHALKAAGRLAPESTIVVVSPENRDVVVVEIGDDFEYTEQPDPLGTGHALAVALERVPFSTRHLLLLNGDMPLITGDDLAGLASLHLKRGAALTLLTAVLSSSDAHDLGVLHRGARGKAIEIEEAADGRVLKSASVEVVVGAYALDVTWARGAAIELPKHGSGEYYVTDLVAMAVAEGRRVEALATSSLNGAIGVNTRSQLARAERAMQIRLREQAMDGGATLIDPDTVYLDATVELAADVTVYPNTSITGATRIGVGASIGPNAQVADSIIGPGAVIGAAVVQSSTLEAGAQVGPFSLLREGTYLERDVFIGAHAEVKASKIGRGTHIGHFSYVGDAMVGEDVNIGAGTVTCNYDGTAKHVTEIGDGAFIGSGSMLVAPVRVGAGALTGAGAVVNREVAPGERVGGVPARPLASDRKLDMAAGSEGGTTLG